MRGGAFKPRTSPYCFQGLGVEGLELLHEAKAQTGLLIITEVMEPGYVEDVEKYADIFQIGCRSMQNFPLLKRVGCSQKPVLLKRGYAATLDELLGAAEYIALSGNPNIILCERGIRTVDDHFRHTLDLLGVLILKERTNLPVIIDPSHACRNRNYVSGMAKAASVVGGDGLMVEIHPNPKEALCDSVQALGFNEFRALYHEIRNLRKALQ
jgi:3-deoxy-7-phosphoheptulonate synthase